MHAIGAAQIATLFETIDLNGDGVISKDEWRQGFAKFTAAAEAESEAAEEAAEAEAERKAARDASARNREKRPQSARRTLGGDSAFRNRAEARVGLAEKSSTGSNVGPGSYNPRGGDPRRGTIEERLTQLVSKSPNSPGFNTSRASRWVSEPSSNNPAHAVSLASVPATSVAAGSIW